MKSMKRMKFRTSSYPLHVLHALRGNSAFLVFELRDFG